MSTPTGTSTNIKQPKPPATAPVKLPVNLVKELGIFILLVVLCVGSFLVNHQFGEGPNLHNLAQSIGRFGIISIGMGIVIITGGIDLSVGSMFALLGVLLSIMLDGKNMAWPLAVVIILLLGAGLGAIHGLLIVKMKLQPFIVTLCGLLLYRGLARTFSGDNTMGFVQPDKYRMLEHFTADDLTIGSHFAMPMVFICLTVVAVVFYVVLHKSIFGRYLYAVGRNEDATRYSGVNTNLVVGGAYVISGFLAALASIYEAFYTNSISPSSHGNFYELYAVAAAVLGGCSLRGGEGSIIGIVIGTAVLQVIRNMVNLLGIPSSLEYVVMGSVILLGVIADRILTQRRPGRA